MEERFDDHLNDQALNMFALKMKYLKNHCGVELLVNIVDGFEITNEILIELDEELESDLL